MALLVPDVGEVEMLSRILNYSATGNVVLRLFTNNVTPGETNVVGSYTEMNGMGYAAKTLTGTSWSIATLSGVTSAAYAEQSFDLTAGSGVVAYGYYVTNVAGSVLLWAERFTDGPYTIPTGGGSIKITPNIQLA